MTKTKLEIRRLHCGYKVRRINIHWTSTSAFRSTCFYASAVSICARNISMFSASGFPHCWEWICTGIRNRLYSLHVVLTVHMLWYKSLCFMSRGMYVKEQASFVLWTQKLKFSILTSVRFFEGNSKENGVFCVQISAFDPHFSYPRCKLLLSVLFQFVRGLKRGRMDRDELRPGKGKGCARY